MKSQTCPDQLITFTRGRLETRSIKYRDLPAAASNQAAALQLPGSVCERWPLNTQHFREQALGDLQRVIVTAVTHHQQPTR
jgi:hypothetical protein